MKKNFKLKTEVRFINCAEGAGMTGYILGKSSQHAEMDFYIVMLDKPLPESLAIVMTEYCLEPIDG